MKAEIIFKGFKTFPWFNFIGIFSSWIVSVELLPIPEFNQTSESFQNQGYSRNIFYNFWKKDCFDGNIHECFFWMKAWKKWQVVKISYSTNNVRSFSSRPLVNFKICKILIMLIKVLVIFHLVLVRTVCMQKSHCTKLAVLKYPLCIFMLSLWKNSHFYFSKIRDCRWLNSAGQTPDQYDRTLKLVPPGAGGWASWGLSQHKLFQNLVWFESEKDCRYQGPNKLQQKKRECGFLLLNNSFIAHKAASE